jgi:D-alanyl-D-alanine carboxypeptidase
MTADLVRKHYPLHAGDSGPRFVWGRTMSWTPRRGAALPSANNSAVLVARQVSGSVISFVAEMNRMARAAGMSHTTYTDPSGYDDGTVSTALDQLRLAQVVAKDETLVAMMATRTHWLPVAGEVTNTNALLGHDGLVGMKTGSDGTAGGCLMFRAVWPTESGDRSLIGVVLGQRPDNRITAGLSAAKQLADRLAPTQHSLKHPACPAWPDASARANRGATPAGAYRRHIENHIRAGNTPMP